MTALHRLIYRSRCAMDAHGEIAGLLEASRAANREAGVTGALLMSSGWFVQALEGPSRAVELTFERICGDLRHREVRLVEYAAIETRSFAEWSMALLDAEGSVLDLAAAASRERAVVDVVNVNALIQLMRAVAVSSPDKAGESEAAAAVAQG